MKVLVIDDTENHLKAALQTLIGHEVTTCSDYDQALKLLELKHNESELDTRLKRYREEGMNFDDAFNKALKETALPYWDAVLCDLLMPAGRDIQGNKGMEFVGQEMAVGWSLALVATKNGAKYVAVATDIDHHNHPASAMLDRFNKHVFSIDSTKMLLTNRIDFVDIEGTEHKCPECWGFGTRYDENDKEYDCYCCKGGVAYEKGKNWGEILNQLIGVNEAS